MAPILSHAVDLIGRLRFATKPPRTQLTPSSAIEHEENGVPIGIAHRSGTEQPPLDSLENSIDQNRTKHPQRRCLPAGRVGLRIGRHPDERALLS